MRLLVLGRSSFVGRAVVEDSLRRGWAVTTFNRGQAPWTDPRVGSAIDPGELELDGLAGTHRVFTVV